MIVIGIDPGVTGSVAFLHTEHGYVDVVDIPTMAHGKGKAKVKKQINPAGLAELFENVNVKKVVLEKVSAMPEQGVASVFSLGDTFGCIRGVVGALGLPLELVTPREWKKHFKLTSDKEVCRAKAIELYPEAPLHLKKHHNRSEALLIARYGIEKI